MVQPDHTHVIILRRTQAVDQDIDRLATQHAALVAYLKAGALPNVSEVIATHARGIGNERAY